MLFGHLGAWGICLCAKNDHLWQQSCSKFGLTTLTVILLGPMESSFENPADIFLKPSESIYFEERILEKILDLDLRVS